MSVTTGRERQSERRVRSGCPVATLNSYLDRHEAGFVRITDPSQVRAVLRRVDDFAADNALTAAVPLTGSALRILARGRVALPPVLASASGDAHRLVRSVVARAFSPAKVDATTDLIAELARARAAEVGAHLREGHTADLSTAITGRVTPAVFTHLTGIDLPAPADLRRWGRDSLELFWGFPDAGRQELLAASVVALFDWLRASAGNAPADADSSLIGGLRRAGIDEARILSLLFFLAIGGQETTAMLADTVLDRAIREPGVWDRVAHAERSEAVRVAVEFVDGVLATESSVPTWRRVAAHDTDLDGTPIPAGTPILVQLSGTGHPDADDSLAFGYGVHRCLGARLAPLEASTILLETARALPDLEAVGDEPARFRLLSFQAPTAVPVRRRG